MTTIDYPVETPPRTPVPETRNQVITRRAEAGEDLSSIGADYAMSRERVRQIVAGNTTMVNDEIRDARKARRKAARDAKDAAHAVQIRLLADQHPDATISVLADLTGYATGVIRAALDWTERERRAEPQQYASVPDEDIFAELRRIAGLPGGRPLTGRFYDENRVGGLSHARLLQRFETWTAACTAAGVTPRGPNPGRTYERRWTPETMVGWVWAYLSSAQSPSYSRFDQWLRTQPDAPSAQTIRNTLGSWVEMKRRAIEDHAQEAKTA